MTARSLPLRLPLPPSLPLTTPSAVLLLALAFALFYQLGVPLRATHGARVNVDEPFYLLTTVSLLQDGDLDLTNDYQLQRFRAFFDHPQELWRQSVPNEDGRLLSPHNVGLSLLILPAYAWGGVDGAKGFLAALGGLTVAAMFLVAYRASGHVAASFAAAALLGASAPLFVYASQLYPEAPAALLVACSAWLLLGGRPGLVGAACLALALTGLVWLGVKYAFVGSAIALIALARLQPRARSLLLALLAPSSVAYAWFHLATYGGLTPYAVNRLYAGSGTAELLGLHLEVGGRLYRLVGLWVDGEFGLVRWAPILLLAFVGLPLVARRGGSAWWLLALVFGTQLLVAVFLSITMRGWWFPGRMLVAALPLLVMPLAECLRLAAGRPWLAGAAAALGAYGLGLTLALRQAVAAETVVLAVDPFALPWGPFQAVAGLFPVYTSYEPLTWLLTAAWVLAGGGLVLLGWRLKVAG